MEFLKRVWVFIFILGYTTTVFCQNYDITGKITDSKTKELLIGVTISLKNNPVQGTITNERGEFKLSLAAGEYVLKFDYLGYEEKEISVLLHENLVRDVSLVQQSIQMDEVVVTVNRSDANVSDVQTGVEHIQLQQINKLPVLLGERDIIKSLQLMPGVKSAGESSSGFFVRGGTADQNLIMLDNVSVYNASHLMGFFSTFNSDVLRDASLYKGAIPAQYGERLSAILDVQQRNGDINKLKVSGGIGLISSKLSLEGPIKKGKSSFLIGGRRTYADAIARLSGVEEANNAYLYFYDLNMKLYFSLSDKDQLSVSGYLGRDKMELKDLAETDWGNIFTSLKWIHVKNDKLSFHSSLFYNRYSYNMKMDMGMEMVGTSHLNDYGLKEEINYKLNESNLLRFGLQSTFHDIAPGDYDISSETSATVNLYHRYSLENGLYASNQWKVTDRLEVIYGARLSVFSAMGKGEYYELDEEKNVIDSIWYGAGKFVKTYVNLEPRLSAVYKLNNESSVKASYARTTQNMHLLTYVAQGSPYDRWTSSSNNVKPQLADQYSIGYFRNFLSDLYEFSAEAYYKDMRNQIDFKDNADIQGYNVIETELLYGKGRAYGIEFMLKKRTGRLNGWISYTLAKSEKKINGINNNQWYDSYQDRTHDISVVGVYELNPKWTLSATWVYYTGNALTYPSGKYQIDGKDVMYYAERNGYRAPAYHRLDLGATCLLKKTSKYESELALGLYNAYGRRNAYMIQFKTNIDDPSKTSAYRYALFTYIPSISWNFKF